MIVAGSVVNHYTGETSPFRVNFMPRLRSFSGVMCVLFGGSWWELTSPLIFITASTI